MARIHGKEQPIKEIFSDAYAFSIPEYQRPYSWGREQASELFADLQTAASAAAGGAMEPYFLGSVVLIKPDSQPETEVIDGQQRLTTLALLIAVLAKTREKLGQLLYEEGDEVLGTQDRFRIAIRPRDNGFFENEILRVDSFKSLRPSLSGGGAGIGGIRTRVGRGNRETSERKLYGHE